MVKTRHNHDGDEDCNDTFLSLAKRTSIRTRLSDLKNDDDSDDSGVINFKKTATTQDQEMPRMRASRSTTKRVTYEEDTLIDTDSEIEARRPTRRSGARIPLHIKHDTSDNDSNAEVDNTPPQRRTGRKCSSVSPNNRVRRNSGPVSREERAMRSHDRTARPRRTADFLVTHPSPRQIKREQIASMEEEDETGMRRSSRTRRSTYHTYDQKVLERSFELDEQPRRRSRREVEPSENAEENDDGFTDIYSRVKRKRKVVKRDMYGMPIETDNEEMGEDDDGDEDEEVDSDDQEDDNGNNNIADDDNQSDGKLRRSYNLRENKPRTQLYIAPIQERRPKNRFFTEELVAPHSPARSRTRRSEKLAYRSPARKRGIVDRHRKRAFHGSSSTSSSSSDDGNSGDEKRFQRRKAKSMMKARQRCLPMNFDPDDITQSTLLRDRQKIGSSLADVDPMNIDRSITFDSVGGLGKHVLALKEMVVFPLMYPEIFERFKIAPPRGVLFYGPPGTGKTLVARALANECSHDDRRVAFYMRKGADCLSKWVGESERQLRLLFDQAYQTRPSIIFFDEIDGLAPVRSSRQDQIHSSIVSTLLALMDGLDSRGEIVVIGATNRLDSIDPALRRPGRFDREFLFPLPSVKARGQILKIHTKEWNPKLCDKFVSEVAEKCLGYCGADVKALCTEAALLALRRRYPQIYTSSVKLQIDVSSINVNAKDFHNAMRNVVPASQRSVTSPARSLTVAITPLLQGVFKEILTALNDVFPSVLMQLSNLDTPVSDGKKSGVGDSETGTAAVLDLESDDDQAVSIFEQKPTKRGRKLSYIPDSTADTSFLNFTSYANRHPSTHRPRLLLSGHHDQGQTSHLSPAVIHHLEQLPVHTLDLSALYAVSARSPEESCAHIFREARRTSPCIVYLPHVSQWWNVVGETVRSTVLTLIQDLEPSTPVLLLATSEERYNDLDYSLQDLFDEYSGEVITMRNPSSEERRQYFRDLILVQTTRPPPTHKQAEQRDLEVLPKAPPPEPRTLTENEQKKLLEHEEATLTELRLFLRDVLNKLGRERKFFIFTKPVDIEDVPDYYEVITKPMDLSTMMSKIDLHHYQSVAEFLDDISQICLNALEYNPDKDQQSRVIRHRACALKDTAAAIIKAELDSEFEKVCLSIVESRRKRGIEGPKTAPSYYHTRPLNTGGMHPLAIAKQSTTTITTSDHPSTQGATPRDPNVRTSRRLQGAEAVYVPPLEIVEKSARINRSIQKNSPEKMEVADATVITPKEELKRTSLTTRSGSGSRQSQAHTGTHSGNKVSSGSSSAKRTAKKDIWGSSGYKKRKRKRRRLDSHNDGEDLAEITSDNEDGEGGEESSGEIGDNAADSVQVNDTGLDVDNFNVDDAPTGSQDCVNDKAPKESKGCVTVNNNRDHEEGHNDDGIENNSTTSRDNQNNSVKIDGSVASPAPGSSRRLSQQGSVADSLSVDVHVRSTHLDHPYRSPEKRSPRSAVQVQKSPRQQADDPPTQRSPGAAVQKSPRQHTDTSPTPTRSPDPSHMTTRHSRHSIDSKSPNSAPVTVFNGDVVVQKSANSVPSSNNVAMSSNEALDKSGNAVTLCDSENANLCPPVNITDSAEAVKKTGVEAAGVVSGFVDSGVGSSDNSGDSNDSLGKIVAGSKEGEQTLDGSQTAQSMGRASCEQGQQPMEEGSTPTKKDTPVKETPSPVCRQTRLQAHARSQEKAATAQSDAALVYKARLTQLLDLTVMLTEDYPVPYLEKLYSLNSQCIFQHRLEHDKTHLIEALERRLRQYTSNITQRRKVEASRMLALNEHV